MCLENVAEISKEGKGNMENDSLTSISQFLCGNEIQQTAHWPEGGARPQLISQYAREKQPLYKLSYLENKKKYNVYNKQCLNLPQCDKHSISLAHLNRVQDSVELTKKECDGL